MVQIFTIKIIIISRICVLSRKSVFYWTCANPNQFNFPKTPITSVKSDCKNLKFWNNAKTGTKKISLFQMSSKSYDNFGLRLLKCEIVETSLTSLKIARILGIYGIINGKLKMSTLTSPISFMRFGMFWERVCETLLVGLKLLFLKHCR